MKAQVAFLFLALYLSLSAFAVADVVTINSGSVNTDTGDVLFGAVTTLNLNVSQFPDTLGTLNEIRISHTNTFNTAAISQATGGNFIPPDFLDGWTWSAQNFFELSDSQGTLVRAEEDLLRFGSVTDDTPNHEALVVVTNQISNSEVVTIGQSDPRFSSYRGNETIQLTFQAGVTTYFPPAPQRPAGFFWGLSTIDAAAIRATSQSNISISYDYTPTVAVPEPSSRLPLAFGFALFWKRFRRRNNV